MTPRRRKTRSFNKWAYHSAYLFKREKILIRNLVWIKINIDLSLATLLIEVVIGRYLLDLILHCHIFTNFQESGLWISKNNRLQFTIITRFCLARIFPYFVQYIYLKFSNCNHAKLLTWQCPTKKELYRTVPVVQLRKWRRYEFSEETHFFAF